MSREKSQVMPMQFFFFGGGGVGVKEVYYGIVQVEYKVNLKFHVNCHYGCKALCFILFHIT